MTTKRDSKTKPKKDEKSKVKGQKTVRDLDVGGKAKGVKGGSTPNPLPGDF